MLRPIVAAFCLFLAANAFAAECAFDAEPVETPALISYRQAVTTRISTLPIDLLERYQFRGANPADLHNIETVINGGGRGSAGNELRRGFIAQRAD